MAPDCLELCLEQVLVDLALVDRDAFRDAELDDRFAVHVELLRELVGRQVIRHRPCPLSATKKPADARAFGRARSALVCWWRGSTGPPPENVHVLRGYSARRARPQSRTPNGASQTGLSTSM